MKSTTTFDEITVFGSRGTTLMILSGLQEYWKGRVRIRAIIDEVENGFQHPGLDVPVISSAERQSNYEDVPVLVTPTNSSLRRRVFDELAAQGATVATAICPAQPHVDPDVEYGAGCIVVPHVRIGPGTRIGVGTVILSTVVAHDVQIGDFCNLATYSSIMGHVVIEDDVHIAPMTVIGNGTREKPLRIGTHAKTGIGTVVVRDMDPASIMVGNPAMSVAEWRNLRRLAQDRGS